MKRYNCIFLKTMLPLAVAALLAIILAALRFQDISNAPDGEEQLGFAIGYALVLVLTIIPMILFIPFGLGLIVCEIFLFTGRRRSAAISALVLLCVLSPVFVFVAILLGAAMAPYSTTLALILVAAVALYAAAVVAASISVHKLKKLKREQYSDVSEG